MYLPSSSVLAVAGSDELPLPAPVVANTPHVYSVNALRALNMILLVSGLTLTGFGVTPDDVVQLMV